MSVIRAKGWCFTINNPTHGDQSNVCDQINLNSLYGIAEMEHNEGEGTPHIQGYIFFEKRQCKSTVERWLGGRAFLTTASLYSST